MLPTLVGRLAAEPLILEQTGDGHQTIRWEPVAINKPELSSSLRKMDCAWN